MSGDQSEYKIQNAPLMTPEQKTMLSGLLSGYMNMMQGTQFGQAYPGPMRSGYNPKTFQAPIISYKGGTVGGVKGGTEGGGWKWKSGGNGGGGGGIPPGGPAPEPNPGPGQPGPGPTPYPEGGLSPTQQIMQVLARQYTNPLVSPSLFTGNFPKRTGGY